MKQIIALIGGTAVALLLGAAIFTYGPRVVPGQSGQTASAGNKAHTPAPTPDPAVHPVRPLPASIPIITYHHVRPESPTRDYLGNRLSTPPMQFSHDLDELKQAGYHTVTFRDLGRPLPPKPIILTFDDGYVDSATYALPILVAHGFRATFFIVPGFLGQPDYLKGDQVQALHDADMEIGAHTMTHPELTHQTLAQQTAEIGQSVDFLAAQVGTRPVSLAYPYGEFNQDSITAAKAAKLEYAVTTAGGIAGPSDDPFTLPRFAMNSDDTLALAVPALGLP